LRGSYKVTWQSIGVFCRRLQERKFARSLVRMGIRPYGHLSDWFVMVLNDGMKCTARKLSGFEKSIPTLNPSQIDFVNWRVKTNKEYLHTVCTCVRRALWQTLKQYIMVHKYESARVSRSAAILFNGHSPIHLRYVSSKHVGIRFWSPWRAGNCIYKPRKCIILCNMIWFIRLFIYLICLTCPSVYVSILSINTSVCPSSCSSSCTKSVAKSPPSELYELKPNSPAVFFNP